MNEPLSKGAGFLTLKEVWTEVLPPAELAAVVVKLSPEARAIWDHPPLAVSWTPQRPAFELHRRIEEHLRLATACGRRRSRGKLTGPGMVPQLFLPEVQSGIQRRAPACWT